MLTIWQAPWCSLDGAHILQGVSQLPSSDSSDSSDRNCWIVRSLTSPGTSVIQIDVQDLSGNCQLFPIPDLPFFLALGVTCGSDSHPR